MPTNYQDVALASLFTLGAANQAELADIVLFNRSFSDVLLSLSGYDITLAAAVSLAALGVAWVVNQPGWNRMSDGRKGILGLTVALILLGIGSTAYQDLITGSHMVGITTVAIQAGGYWAIAVDC